MSPRALFRADLAGMVAEVVRDLEVAHGGELYAQIAALVPRRDYDAIVAGLVSDGLVTIEGEWLEWVKEET